MNQAKSFIHISAVLLVLCASMLRAEEAPQPKIDRGFKFDVFADGTEKKVTIKAGDIYKHAKFLASDECDGRFPGTPGHAAAQKYIIEQLNDAGYKEVKKFPFDFVADVKLGSDNFIAAVYAKDTATDGANWYRKPGRISSGSLKPATGNVDVLQAVYGLNADFRPFRISESGKLDDVPLVFAGYGISAPDKNYDDYKDLDVKGKIVLVLRREPETAEGKRIGTDKPDPHAPFSMYSDLFYKASTARDKGAVGMIVVNGPRGMTNAERAALEDFQHGTGGRTSCGLPLVQVFPEVADDWLRPAGKNIADLQKVIDEKIAPQNFPIAGVTLSMNISVDRQRITDENLAVVLPGNDPALKDEIVVIGAHYDHLGHGNEFSLADKTQLGQIHRGADDNASGTSSVIELARALYKNRKNLKRTVWIMWYSAEELGTIGSIDFLKRPPPEFVTANAAAMLNLDMVGRCRDKKVMVYGVGTGSGFDELLKKSNEGISLDLKPTADGFGGSDQTPFVNAGVPVLFFFTGSHPDYHRPSDTADKLNVTDQALITALVYKIAVQVINAPERPKFIKLEAPKMGLGIGRVRLGTMPDYSFEGKGLRITGVRGGSAADKAGLKGGDIVIKLGEKRVDNIQDYMIALNSLNPGEETAVVIQRDGKEETLKVTPDKP